MSESASLTVSGMKCGGCESSIVSKVSAIAGVVTVQASHKDKRVEVEFDPAQTDLDEIEDVITDAGFKVE
ncbi:heavy-metal-associated domain-containing protein [Methylomonas sp. MO1]|uniref:Mercuric reductase n=2 Tax=Methylomonas TaxID=416 RepID=A0A177MUS0_METMH|nr:MULTISPECIES: heavy-metal-associated domain-containing protein [Methylomonas]MCQ8117552.1 cation transporter [Methylomonas sp. WSC-7]MDT4290921.1 heavy-metal-associated domain-containing protein [Methylomonas sp. MO1]OAI09466.1 mercuric reductase [Methylomonas methanica]